MHDVFIRYLDRIDTYIPEKGRLFTWMLNIARNLSIDRLRSREINDEMKTTRVGDYVHFEKQGGTSETFVEGIGVPDLLQRLPEEQRFVVYNLYFNGYSHSELSKEFNIPLGTVKTRLRLGMQELRNLLT